MHAVVVFLHGMQYIVITIIVICTLYLCMASSLPSSYGNMHKREYFSVLRMHELPLYLRIYMSSEQSGRCNLLEVILIINLAS